MGGDSNEWNIDPEFISYIRMNLSEFGSHIKRIQKLGTYGSKFRIHSLWRDTPAQFLDSSSSSLNYFLLISPISTAQVPSISYFFYNEPWMGEREKIIGTGHLLLFYYSSIPGLIRESSRSDSFWAGPGIGR